MNIFHYNKDTGDFFAYGEADPDPLTPDGWLIPAHATKKALPGYDPQTQTCKFINGSWVVENIPVPEPVVDPEPVPPTMEQMINLNIKAIQVEMDRMAKTYNYDNIISACSYAPQPVGAPFQAEGAAFLAWRSVVWSQAYAVLARVQAGEIPLPTVEEAIAAMPELVI
jgi:hypothetical protein